MFDAWFCGLVVTYCGPCTFYLIVLIRGILVDVLFCGLLVGGWFAVFILVTILVDLGLGLSLGLLFSWLL